MGLPIGQPLVIDGLAYGVMAEEAKSLRERYTVVALVHHPLALETGLADRRGRGSAHERARRAGRRQPRHRNEPMQRRASWSPTTACRPSA